MAGLDLTRLESRETGLICWIYSSPYGNCDSLSAPDCQPSGKIGGRANRTLYVGNDFLLKPDVASTVIV